MLALVYNDLHGQHIQEMKTLLVTSEVTFVPRNYDDVVIGLAACPQVGGLLVLRNRSLALTCKACALIGAGAWGLGGALLVNQGPASRRRRHEAYAAQNKEVWTLDTINDPQAVALVKDHGFDCILNARTRFIYGLEILSAPPLGCINIHHGLLPEQRGTMCDLWALYQSQAAGFSIHTMETRIDAGGIIAREAVSDGGDRDYPAYLQRACRMELEAARRVLQAIEDTGAIHGEPNPKPEGLVMRRNPNFRQLRNMIKSGLRL